MKRKLAFCVLVLACLVIQATPVMASGSTDITGTVPLVTYEVSVSNIGYYTATISWKTNGNATSQVFYDTVSRQQIGDYRYYTTEDPSLVAEHSIRLTGLSSGTTYRYRVRSAIPGTDFVAISDEHTFTTLSPPPPDYYEPPSPPPPAEIQVIVEGEVVTYKISAEGKVLETIERTSSDERTTITIPEGTTALDREGNPLTRLDMDIEIEPPPPPEGTRIIGLAYDFGPPGATFDPPMTLTWKYDPADTPEGVDEEELIIAYYDEEAGEWVGVTSVVDVETKTITASVSHFTTFAIVGPVRLPAFKLTLVDISPPAVDPGDPVTITVLVSNVGTREGRRTVVLKIDRVTEAEKTVLVAAGESETLAFTVTRDDPGVYRVLVNGLTGSFTVKELPPEPAAFTVSDLTIHPAEVSPGEVVTIGVTVTNVGGTEDSYTVVLKINNVKEDEKSVTLEAGKSREVSFSVTREEPGIYTVTVDDLSGSFTVAEVPPVKPPVKLPLIGGIIAAVVVIGVVIFLVLRKRAKTQRA